MKWTNCESSDSEEVYKMRRAVFILVFCSLVLITQSILSQQSWKDFVDNQDEKKESLRLTGMSWSPSDITVTFKKKIQNLTNSYRQGRALVATTAIQKQQFPISQSATVKKTRSNDSGGRDVGDSDEYSDESEDVEEDIRGHDDGGHGNGHGHGHGHIKKKKRKKHKKKFKVRRKYKKFLMPLLIAYKLKFFALIPVFIAALLLLVKTAGLAGFFFALFSAVMALKGKY